MPKLLSCSLLASVGCLAAASLVGCTRSAPEPESIRREPMISPVAATNTPQQPARNNPPPTRPPEPTARAAAPSAAVAVPEAPETVVKESGDDPLGGKWSLKDATKDLPGQGTLVAAIETSAGKIECKLLADKAPNTVANFIGLASGQRPWKKPGGSKWIKKRAYDGTIFHRTIAGFMIQGGDPAGNGSGEPGYVIPDEIWEGAKHNRAGLLCMANRGHDTNGAQFFITDAAAEHLDGNYTIFGECEPVSIVHDIATAPGRGERPVNPVVIQSVKVTRAADKKK